MILNAWLMLHMNQYTCHFYFYDFPVCFQVSYVSQSRFQWTIYKCNKCSGLVCVLFLTLKAKWLLPQWHILGFSQLNSCNENRRELPNTLPLIRIKMRGENSSIGDAWLCKYQLYPQMKVRDILDSVMLCRCRNFLVYVITQKVFLDLSQTLNSCLVGQKEDPYFQVTSHSP